MVLEEPLKEEVPPHTHWQCGPQRPLDVGPHPKAALLSHCSKTAGPSLPKPVPCSTGFAPGSGGRQNTLHLKWHVGSMQKGTCTSHEAREPLNMSPCQGPSPASQWTQHVSAATATPGVQGLAHLSPADQCSRNFYLPSSALPQSS